MARMKTVRKNNFPHFDNNVRTTKAPLIGFEWEVPVAYDTKVLENRFYNESFEVCLYIGGRESHRLEGYKIHDECGCVEFASPVGQTIAVARRAAKTLSKVVDKYVRKGLFNTENCHEYNEGGIHVSVSDPKGGYDKRTYAVIYGLLNQTDMKTRDFLWEFSGRDENDYYSRQAEPQGIWNCTTVEDLYDYLPEPWSEVKMLKDQDGERIEVRLWDSQKSLLIPAIEFTHAIYCYARDYKGERIPHLRDFKKWLFKRKGYKTLKSIPQWSIVNV